RRLRNKGRELHTILTINGRVELERTRWHNLATGSVTPADPWLDVAEATVSLGARELACRLNQGARSFAKAADNLARAAQIRMSDELLRQVVEAEGKAVLTAQKAGQLTIPWAAGVLHTAKHHGHEALAAELGAWKGTLRGRKRQAAEVFV